MAHPNMHPVSFTYLPVAYMQVITLHSLFLYSDPPLPCHLRSYWLRLFSSQTFSCINTPTFLKPSHSSYLPAYEDGTVCSEMLAYKIQIPENYPEESIQRSEHSESLKWRTKKLLCKKLLLAWTWGVCVLLQHFYRWPDKNKFKILL